MNKSLVLGCCSLVLIAALGLLAYSNTFDVPFVWDGKYLVAKNPIVRDLDYFLNPSGASGFGDYSITLKQRYIGYLTFALNYKVHGLDVRGYHIVNLSVHILNSLLVYLLVVLTFRAPFLMRSSLKEHSRQIALFSALLFVSHPVQTEAVTYIFQRFASLVTFFYLLSLVSYISSRLSTGKPGRYALYTVSLVSAVLAMKTKENAFTLPVAIMLYEFFFFNGLKQRRILYLIPFLLTLFIIPLTLTGVDSSVSETIRSLGPETRGAFSRVDYLLTQFRVIVTYIRLLFLPLNQNIDYDYPLISSFFDLRVLLSLLFLLSILIGAVYLLKQSKITGPDVRLVSFGIFWFFLALSVESSIISLPMLIDEYRLYLPSVGAFMAFTTGMFLFLERLKEKRFPKAFITAGLVVLPLVFSYAAYARNTVWKTEISLWEDVVSKSPSNARGHYNLGNAYSAGGLTDRAIEHYRIVLRQWPDHEATHYNLGNAYSAGGLTDRAIEHYRIALRLKPGRADTYNNLGVAYYNKGWTDKAVEYFQGAVKIKPDNARAHYNLGRCYIEKGLTEKARKEFETALQIAPAMHQARQALNHIPRGQ